MLRNRKQAELKDIVPKDLILDLRKDLVGVWRSRVRDDKDGVGVVSGEKGCGKSTFCWEFAKYFNSKSTIKDNFCYAPTYENIVRQFDGLPQYSCLVIDEAAKGAYGRNWMTEANKALSQYYMTNRKFHNKLSLFAIPKFARLDVNIRDLTNFWVTIIDRGVAAVFLPDESEFAPDRFFFEDNMAKVEKARSRSDYYLLETQLEIYSSLRGFSGFVGWSDWEDGEEDEYLALSDLARKELAGLDEGANPEAEHWLDVAGNFAKFAWRKFTSYSTKRMFEETGVSVKDLNYLVREFNIDRKLKHRNSSVTSVAETGFANADEFEKAAVRRVDEIES